MASNGKWIVLTIAAGSVLAVPAALPVVFQLVGDSLTAADWLPGAGAALAVALCLFVSTGTGGRSENRPLCPWVAAMSLAGLAPLAVEANLHRGLADGAFLCSALAVAIGCGGRGWMRTVCGAILIGLVSALDGTALLWPIGVTWAALARRRRRGTAGVWLATGVLGVVLSWIADWPLLAGHLWGRTIYAAHRDLTLLVPVLVLGWAGYARGWKSAFRSGSETCSPWLAGWATMGTLGLVLVLVGMPLDVRICVLPLWWYMPLGLHDLARIMEYRSRCRRMVRGVISLVFLMVAVLALTGLRQWLDGLFIGLYLICFSA